MIRERASSVEREWQACIARKKIKLRCERKKKKIMSIINRMIFAATCSSSNSFVIEVITAGGRSSCENRFFLAPH